jgi:hypothetical protein
LKSNFYIFTILFFLTINIHVESSQRNQLVGKVANFICLCENILGAFELHDVDFEGALTMLVYACGMKAWKI